MVMFTIDAITRDAALAVVLVVLAAGAFGKLRAWNDFVAVVAAYRVIPVGMAAAFAVAIVCLELVACGLLLVERLRWLGAGAAALVIVLASAGVVVNLWRGRIDIHCGCGGLTRTTGGAGGLSWWLVGRNVVLLALVGASVAPPTEGPPRWPDPVAAMVTLGAALMMLTLYATASQLVSNHVIMRRRRQ